MVVRCQYETVARQKIRKTVVILLDIEGADWIAQNQQSYSNHYRIL